MDKAIEIVQAMYDEAMVQYNAIPSYIIASEATLERIETLEEVLHALKAAEERERKAMEREIEEFEARRCAYMRNLNWRVWEFAKNACGGCDEEEEDD